MFPKQMFPKSRDQSRLKINNKFELKKINKIDSEIITKFINKIMGRYNHPELLEKFQSSFNQIKENFETIINLLTQLIDLMNQSYAFLSKPNNVLNLQDYTVMKVYTYGKDSMKFIEFIYKFEILLNQIDMLCIYNFAMIVDIFFLRRFLDKDYITNAIVYTGSAHSIFYIYFLVKNFDFKIRNKTDSFNIECTNSVHQQDYIFVKDKIEKLKNDGLNNFTESSGSGIVLTTPEQQKINLFKLGM